MDLRRMNLLRQAVAEAPESCFHMGTWKCGTMACAAGHYAMRFPAEGIVAAHQELRARGAGPIGWPELAEHFGITAAQSHYLFDPTEYGDIFGFSITAEQVIARIDALIQKYSPVFQGIKTEGDGPAGTYRAECGESAYAMAAVKVEQAVEVERT